MKEILWKPTDEEKKKLERICDDCIKLIGDLPTEQKALVLHTIINSFEDTKDLNIAGMVITKEKGETL